MRPNLFLVGAAKSGTTSLADYLDQHPQIVICRPKEPNYFAYPSGQRPTCLGPAEPDRLYQLLLSHSITDLPTYEALFHDAGSAAYRGDASVRYLYTADAAARIHQYAPDARILVILRDPVERLHSHYHMNVKLGVEPLSLRNALAQEDERVAANWGWDWHYVRVGRYGEQLHRYHQRFDAAQIHVILYEDFVRDPSEVLRRVCAFLGLSPDFRPDTQQRSNVGRTPRSRWLRQLLWEGNLLKTGARRMLPRRLRSSISQWLEARNQRPVPPVPAQLRGELLPRFREDRDQLESLLGTRLPW